MKPDIKWPIIVRSTLTSNNSLHHGRLTARPEDNYTLFGAFMVWAKAECYKRLKK